MRIRPEGSSSGVRPREPSHAREILVLGVLDLFPGALGAGTGAGGFGAREVPGQRGDVFGDEHDVVLELPLRRAGYLLVVGGDAVLHERGFPFVRDDQRPREEQALVGIQEEDGIGFGEAGRIGERERRGPLLCGVIPARGLNQDIVGSALAGAVEPADQEIAVGQFDHGRGVIVPLLQGEDELPGVFGRGRGAGERAEKESEDTHWAQYICDHGGS